MVLVIRTQEPPSRASPASALGPLTLVTAAALPAHVTDTASIPTQPLLAQPMGTVTHWGRTEEDSSGPSPLSCPCRGISMAAVLCRDAHHSCPLPSPHLRCSWARSGPAHTSHRPFRGSPRGSGTPHCPGACPGTAHGPSTPHPGPPGMAHTVSQRNQGSSQAPAGEGRQVSRESKMQRGQRATRPRNKAGWTRKWRPPSTPLPWQG